MFYLRKKHNYRQESEGEGDSGGGEIDPQDNPNAEVEEKARKMGWTEKSSFKGDPDKWRDAAEFVERGENILPIMRKTVEKQERKIADLERSIKEFAEYHTKAEQRAYERAFRELKDKQIQAVSAGDTETFAQIDKEMADLHKEATTQKQPQQQMPSQEYIDWASRNKWVDSDKTMLAYAESQADYLQRVKPGLSYPELLEEVTKSVKKEFPDKFSNPRRESAPSVESSAPAAKRGGKTYADMPKDARDACDRFVSRFGVKKEEYVKQYFEGE